MIDVLVLGSLIKDVSDFSPANEGNIALNQFLSHKLGMFFSFGITTYTESDSYAVNYLNDPPAPTTFSAPSVVDSAQWVQEAIDSGCDYVVLTSGHHIGFNIFPYTAPYQLQNTYDSNRGQLQVPVYENYNVSATSSDQNIVDKFVDKCIISGIKFGIYYNYGKNINMRRGLDLIDSSYDQTDTFSQTYESYNLYAIDEIEHIIRNYSPDYLWLDASHFAPRYYDNNRNNRRYLQDVYNSVKRIKNNCLTIINYDCPVIDGQRQVIPNGVDNVRPPFSWDGTEMNMFPSDIISFENNRKPSNVSDFNPETTHEGVSYYIPREIIDTIMEGQYFAEQDNFAPLVSAVDLQNYYNYARARAVPFLLNVAVGTNGIIPNDQLTRFREITL